MTYVHHNHQLLLAVDLNYRHSCRHTFMIILCLFRFDENRLLGTIYSRIKTDFRSTRQLCFEFYAKKSNNEGES
jgi:hypothetical protein